MNENKAFIASIEYVESEVASSQIRSEYTSNILAMLDTALRNIVGIVP
jgi:hypothetical protein